MQFILEPLDTSVINKDNWPIIFQYKDMFIEKYLINSQIYWEREWGYLCISRMVNFWITPMNNSIKLPVKFIKSLEKVMINYEDKSILNEVIIKNYEFIEIPVQYIGKSLIIEYKAYGFYDETMGKIIIEGALSLIKEQIE